jgi:Peptidase family M23
MQIIFLLQFALPIFFIGLIAFAPLKTKQGFLCQLVATSVGLLALALTGVWLFPPWWMVYIFASLLLFATIVGWRKCLPFAQLQNMGSDSWRFTLGFVAIGCWGVYQSVNALSGRQQQAGLAIDLAFPLKGGTFFVASGGSNKRVNPHLMTLDASMARFHAYRGQSYGVDIVKLNQWGLRANGLQPRELDAYVIYGNPVYAPCSGLVLNAVDGIPNMQVPQVDREHMAGNYVLLRCKNADVLLGHLQPGSIHLNTGNQVGVGEAIARVGNSGNSGEPHLHIHAQQSGSVNEPLSGSPLPMRFEGRYLVRNDRVVVP